MVAIGNKALNDFETCLPLSPWNTGGTLPRGEERSKGRAAALLPPEVSGLMQILG